MHRKDKRYRQMLQALRNLLYYNFVGAGLSGSTEAQGIIIRAAE